MRTPPSQDWDETPEIDDPEEKKPDGYDEIPKQIVDPEASKPDDWDEESDGEWEAPMIDNPEYKVRHVHEVRCVSDEMLRVEFNGLRLASQEHLSGLFCMM